MVREIRPHRLPRERASAAAARLRAPGRTGRAGASYTSQYNTTGWPAGVVRCGTSTEAPGLPLGIQVVAQPWRDDIVLAAMALIEREAGGWTMTPSDNAGDDPLTTARITEPRS